MSRLTLEQINAKPPADLVKQVRERHGLTQPQCAAIVGCSVRTWQRYEENGGMPIGVWWCFLLRVSEINPKQLPPVPPRQRAGVLVGIKCS